MKRRRFGPGTVLVWAVGLLGTPAFGQLALPAPPKAALLNLTLTPNGSQEPPGDRLVATVLLYPGTDRVDLEVRAITDPAIADPQAPDASPEAPRYLNGRGDGFHDRDGRFRFASSAVLAGGDGVVEVSIVVPHAALDVGPEVAPMWYIVTGRVGEDEEFSAASAETAPPGHRLLAPPIALDAPSGLSPLPPLAPVAAAVVPGQALPSPQAPSKTAPAPKIEEEPSPPAPAAPAAPAAPEDDLDGAPPPAPSSVNYSGGPIPAPFAVLPKRSILFATNRTLRAATGTPAERFGDDLDATIRRGSCLVNIPVEGHVQGSLELPRWFNRNDPSRFFLIEATNIIDDQEFRAMLRGGDSRRDVLVYVHGFNTPFDFAVMRLAQIVHDIRFAGVPVAFSWPSHGSVWDYGQDEQNAERSVHALAAVLKEAVDEQAARPDELRGKVHVIAHSLGNRVALRAFDALDSQLPADARPFGQIILAAPDVSVPEFTQRIPTARRRSDRTSLYFCPDDNALLASEAFHPGEPRAGRGVVPLDGLDNIDARKANTSFLGHGYWADVKQLLIDLQMLITLGWPPNQRVFTLESVAGPPPYWGLR